MIRVSVCATPSFECHVCLRAHLSPFSRVNDQLLRVRPSQKLVYENLPVQTKIINGRSRMKFLSEASLGWGKGLSRF